jgi:hypothetical protein
MKATRKGNVVTLIVPKRLQTGQVWAALVRQTRERKAKEGAE